MSAASGADNIWLQMSPLRQQHLFWYANSAIIQFGCPELKSKLEHGWKGYEVRPTITDIATA